MTEGALRRRLGWALGGRLLLVTALFAAAISLYARAGAAIGPDPRLGLIALGYGVTAISAVLLARARHLRLHAGAHVGVDLGLVTLVILSTGGLASPLVVLFHVVILAAAWLRLGTGILATAAASAAVYGALVAALADPAAVPSLGQFLFRHGTMVLSFFAVGLLARYLVRQLTAAEQLLVEREEALDRIGTLQRLVANTIDNGLVVTDGGGRITSANRTAAEILGTDPTASTLATLETLLPGVGALTPDGPPMELTTGAGGDPPRLLRVKVATLSDTFQHAIGRMYVLQDVTTVEEMKARLREQEQIEAYARAVRPRDDAPVEGFEDLVGESEPIRRVCALIARVAPTDSTVLVTGESGTGKELVARALHHRSDRAARSFVPVNCGAIPETLIESELFGHVRGAFTGAVADRPGLFRQADGGTIFLDEIAELPPPMQVRLLRVLQDRMVAPLGSEAARPVDVRIVAATNRNLERLVADGRFREDLYYRLNVIRIPLPPLRERPEDIPLLLMHLLRQSSARQRKSVERLTPRTMRRLMGYAYPGNVRELENVVDHAVTLCEGDTLTEHDLPAHLLARAEDAPPVDPPVAPLLPDGRTLDEELALYEKGMLVTALERSGGVRKRAAELLGIKYRSLRHRLSKYRLASDDDDLETGAAATM